MFINLVMRVYTHTGPLTQVTKELLLVTNNNDDPVMFKVKTTAPKQYCVRPNAGRIEPKSQVEVQGNSYTSSSLSTRAMYLSIYTHTYALLFFYV